MADFIDESGELDNDVIIDDDTPRETGSTADDSAIASFNNEEYGKRVAKRINKLVYEREIEHSERLKLASQVDESNKRIKELEEKLSSISKQSTASQYDTQKAELLERRKIAYAADDFDELAKIDDEMIELRLKQREEPERQPNTPPQQQANGREGQQQQGPSYSQAALDWAQRNANWANNPEYAKQYEAANQMYRKMVDDEFFDAEDPRTYAELDRRLERARVKPPVNAGGGINRGFSSDQLPGGKPTGLTNEDFRLMQGFNLDPDNPGHRAAWLKEKQRSRANGGGY